MTELYQKESDDPKWSGWGYELTIRFAPRGDEPPVWAFNLLERIALETRRKGTVFAAGHRLDSQASIDGADSRFTALAFTVDPELGAIDTTNGRVEFLEVVGITVAELAEMKLTSTDSVLRRIAEVDHRLITDQTR